MTKKTYTGINIQYPISQLIYDGIKSIETRTYPIPKHYVEKDMLLIETPGKKGKFKARAIAIIKFAPSFEYKTKAKFYSETSKHCVVPGSPWAWNNKKKKWGWPILKVQKLKNPITIHKTLGIKYTLNLEIE